MTDNRTTELREKLTERGVDWLDESNGYADVTTFIANGTKWTVISKNYLNPEHDWMALRAERITPEQAIAATLGSESVDYMLNTIGKLEEENERLRSSCGTLTAEQVSKVVYAHSIHADCADADWQAIADELNAELGSERETELGDALNEVAKKWAIAQVEAEDCAKRCMLLEELVRDAYWLIVRAIWSHESQGKFAADWTERMSVLGIEVD